MAGFRRACPFDKGGLTSFSPDGNEIAYNRIFRNFRTWKRYTGGMAQKISLYNFKTNHYEEITRLLRATTRFPCGMATPSISIPIAAPNIA